MIFPPRRWRKDEIRAHLRRDHRTNPDTLKVVVDKSLADPLPIKSTQRVAQIEFNPTSFQVVLNDSLAIRQRTLEQLHALPFREADVLNGSRESRGPSSTHNPQDSIPTSGGPSPSSTDLSSPTDTLQPADLFDIHAWKSSDIFLKTPWLPVIDPLLQSQPTASTSDNSPMSAGRFYPVLDTQTGGYVHVSLEDVEKFFGAPSL